MIFNTYFFVFSVAVFLPLFWLARFPKIRLWVLILYCFVFHLHFAGAAGVLPILILASITFLIGRSNNRYLLLLGAVVCVLALCHYKYSLFFVDEVLDAIAPDAKSTLHSVVQSSLPVTPPLAISFFTFEFVHYLLERRKNQPPIKNVVEFGAFTFFFPSLVAGPIKRYQTFLQSLKEGLAAVSSTQVMLGLLQVVAGYGKKLILADNLNLYIESREVIFHSVSLEERWVVLVSLSLCMYFDFSGYSDIAIGIARMLGVELPPNFNWPYLATNLREFWRRWHISLSTWIRDYIYIPLAGEKTSKLHKFLSALFAFGICGLWHGAAWHFVAWGLYHGLGYSVCTVYRKIPVVGLLSWVFDRAPLLAWFVTMLFVGFSRLLFFYPIPRAFEMFCLLFTWRS